MERYIIFLWIKDHPSGGGKDCIGSKDNKEEAIEQLQRAYDNNIQESSQLDYCGHVYDALDKCVVYDTNLLIIPKYG